MTRSRATFIGNALFLTVILLTIVLVSRPVLALEPMSDGELRDVTGFEGLTLSAKDLASPPSSNELVGAQSGTVGGEDQAPFLGTRTASRGSSFAHAGGESTIKLTGNRSGITTDPLGTSLNSRTVGVDAAAPFYIDMTVQRPSTSSPNTIALPDLSGDLGGDFVIGVNEHRNTSAGYVAMGGLNTPGSIRVQTAP